MKFVMIVMAALLAQTAFAGRKIQLSACSEIGADLTTILTGAESQRSLYKGAVGIFQFDTEEPAAAPAGLAIVYNSPEASEQGFIIRKCVGLHYLAGSDLKNAKSSYDAKSGVTLIINISKPNIEDGGTIPGKIKLNIKTVNTGKDNEGQVISAEEL